MVKIYLDGADLATMKILAGSVDGVTTNPSLMKKAGITEYRSFARAVLDAVGGKPVSFEVLADDLPGMERQAREIAAWGDNVYVKVPVTNSKGEFSGPVIAALSEDGIKLNVTAVFSYGQVQRVWGALERPGSIVSIFAGRIADTGVDPEPLVRQFAEIAHRNGTRILWASAREVFNVVQAERCGCDIITLAPDMIRKLDDFGRDLTAYSLETVRQFYKDAEGISL